MLPLYLASHAWSIDLRAGAAASRPWLVHEAYAADGLEELAAEVYRLPLTAAALVKAFDPRNDADAFVVPTPLVKWACQRGSCGSVFEADTSLHEAVTLSAAPLSAKLAVGAEGSCALESLESWLATLEEKSGRRVLDADVYLTSADSHAACTTSASLGWHIDDIDVLLVMLSGRKRFRVAGCHVGSPICIDHRMMGGDTIFIPALTFHSGGSTTELSEESLMLSVAFAPAEAAARTHTSKVVDHWRLTRQALLERLPKPAISSASASSSTTTTTSHHTWAWAGTADGVNALRGAFAEGSSRAMLLEPFLLPEEVVEAAEAAEATEAAGEAPTSRGPRARPPTLLCAGAASGAAGAPSASVLTVCTGNRCWRNGAGLLLAATRVLTTARTVGCSGVCPSGAVSVCEGPDCDGDAMVLLARDEAEAETSAAVAVAALRRVRARTQPPRCMAAADDDDDDESEGRSAVSSANASEAELSEAPSQSPAGPLQPARRAAGAVADALFVAWSVAIQAAGLALSLGLVLNLCGYGYRVSLSPPGLEIDTLEAMRADNAEQRFLARDFDGLFPE